MTPAERSSITNAIWLCRNCARLIDADSDRYPVAALYHWKRQHEADIRRRLGGSEWPAHATEHIRQVFQDTTPAAQQLVVDRPDYWEFMLTVELLRSGLRETQRQLGELDRGLYFEPTRRLDAPQAVEWFQSKLTDLGRITTMTARASADELNAAWGPLGVAGDAEEIKRVTDLVISGSQHLLEWERDVHFTEGPEAFGKITESMRGWTTVVTDEIFRIPDRIAAIFETPEPEGHYVIDFEILPPKNLDKVVRSLERFVSKYA